RREITPERAPRIAERMILTLVHWISGDDRQHEVPALRNAGELVSLGKGRLLDFDQRERLTDRRKRRECADAQGPRAISSVADGTADEPCARRLARGRRAAPKRQRRRERSDRSKSHGTAILPAGSRKR